MNNNNYRLAQKCLNLTILVAKLVKVVWELLSMTFNYHYLCTFRYAATHKMEF